MENYKFDTLNYKTDLKDVVIPKFQRGLVWSEQKKSSLLETLHNGFPFGALLVASKDGEQESWQVLDGQQRLATIKEYEKKRYFYWEKLNIEQYNKKLEKINNLIGHEDLFIDSKKFNEIDPKRAGDWTDELVEEFKLQGYEELSKDTKKELRNIVMNVDNEVQSYIDLNTLQIPVIKYVGDRQYLPDVFENLNKGGVPLSKYEVFSASWNDTEISLPRDLEFADEILDNIKEYYRGIQKNGEFEIDEFSEDDLNNFRKINLAEFARAFGKFIVSRIPALVSSKDKKAVNEIGYGLLAIITKTPNNQINKIDTKVDTISNIGDILDKANSISKKLNDSFDKILKQNIAFGSKSNSKKESHATGLSTSFKILSYFASLWEADEQNTIASLKNIPAYYVYDALTGVWTAHGDQRLSEYYLGAKPKNYLSPLKHTSFENAYRQWQVENEGNRQKFTKETKALITIHSNLSYLSKNIPNGEDFELEHIIPKARIAEYDKSKKIIHTSSLGNGMFLPKAINNKKKDKTLYEFESVKGNEELIKNSFYPKESDFNDIFENLKRNNFDKVNKYIDDRSEKVMNKIINQLLKN